MLRRIKAGGSKAHWLSKQIQQPVPHSLALCLQASASLPPFIKWDMAVMTPAWVATAGGSQSAGHRGGKVYRRVGWDPLRIAGKYSCYLGKEHGRQRERPVQQPWNGRRGGSLLHLLSSPPFNLSQNWKSQLQARR